MKRILCYAIIVIFGYQKFFGQGTIQDNHSDLTENEPCLTGELFAPELIVDVTTYLNSEWLPGDIYLVNGEAVRNKLIKYNGLLDELFWQEPKSKNVVKLDKESISLFHFYYLNGDTSVYFRKIKVKRSIITDSSEVFGQVIYNGSLSLFVLHTYKIERTELIRKNGIPYEKNVYVKEPVYIFRSANNKTFIVKNLSRRSLYAFSPGNKNKINEFLKANKALELINNRYLIKLTQFLRTIVNQ